MSHMTNFPLLENNDAVMIESQSYHDDDEEEEHDDGSENAGDSTAYTNEDGGYEDHGTSDGMVASKVGVRTVMCFRNRTSLV